MTLAQLLGGERRAKVTVVLPNQTPRSSFPVD